MEISKCIQCGELFERNTKRKYCSIGCSQVFHISRSKRSKSFAKMKRLAAKHGTAKVSKIVHIPKETLDSWLAGKSLPTLSEASQMRWRLGPQKVERKRK